ncbi:hypothetical protein [Pseudohongiella acticola]|jgi:CubicO group peptidase (beta-lactamase class C family)|uniref:hypothetical protein n=1 Tax=Pseudohongiella acticola TaxID=1524254 RepID=UPI0030EEDBBC
MPALGEDIFMAAGLGKQRLYIVPSRDLVVVRFGWTLTNLFSDQESLKRIIGQSD